MIILQYISLFFSQKKQPNLTRTVENRQINEEDNEIRYFMWLNMFIGKVDLATLHAMPVLKTSFKKCFTLMMASPNQCLPPFSSISDLPLSLQSHISTYLWNTFTELASWPFGVCSLFFYKQQNLAQRVPGHGAREARLPSSFTYCDWDMPSSFFSGSHYFHLVWVAATEPSLALRTSTFVSFCKPHSWHHFLVKIFSVLFSLTLHLLDLTLAFGAFNLSQLTQYFLKPDTKSKIPSTYDGIPW